MNKKRNKDEFVKNLSEAGKLCGGVVNIIKLQ